MKPLTVALVTPFEYQPFHSIRQLCGLISQELSSANVEVVSITPQGFLAPMTVQWPAVHRCVSVIERLGLSSAILRTQVQQLAHKARSLKRDFVVLLSDQSLGLMAGILSDFPTVAFVSDLIAARAAAGDFADLGQSSTFGRRFVQRATLAGLASVKGFITPSTATANDLARFIPGSLPRTTVTALPLANSLAPLSAEELSSRQNLLWRQLNMLPRRYFLHVGSSAWYKNRPGVLHLMAELKKTTPTPPAIVFVGAEFTTEEKTLISHAQLEAYHFSQLSSQELNTLYNGAEALLMPSFIEGFGWPALEALAAGTPLVITDTSSLFEHFSAAAALTLPIPTADTLPAWAAQSAPLLLQLLQLSPEERQALTHLGQQHAQAFSLENFREGLLKALGALG